ncbi:ribulose-phosphate 3-epimerase, partial [Candidatus Woesearchaeota archaeon]|nr:ribulose-phosphate 3-epimerase [Candidatus Woesearchaeota archaeon]
RMVSDPKNFISAFSAADSITVHVEANDVDEAIARIKRQKQKIGLALNPDTSVHDVQPYLKDIDFILVMTVHPGFSGQEFIEKAAQKTKLLRPMGKEIWVDGGINAKTKQLVDADVLCAGNYIFASKNPEEAIARLQQ